MSTTVYVTHFTYVFSPIFWGAHTAQNVFIDTAENGPLRIAPGQPLPTLRYARPRANEVAACPAVVQHGSLLPGALLGVLNCIPPPRGRIAVVYIW